MRDQPPEAFTHLPANTSDEPTFDPLPLCIYTTIGILAWIFTPALVVAVFGVLGVVGYVSARRRGLAKSRCKLGDTRLVVTYLAIAATAGIVATAIAVVDWVT